jgi:ribosomal-protein-alanine N-acetyltransferase
MADAEGRIAGRLNLRFIDPVQGSGEIGYRIGELHCGKGWASASVRHMQQLAYGKWALTSLVAYVNVENPASVRVLEKNGFVRQEFVPERSFVQQRKIDGYRYLHTSA